MLITPRCNYAGSHGKLIPTRSRAAALAHALAARLAATFRLRR
jgi:hypothetical protein